MAAAKRDLDELERTVAKMRDLGVTEWGDIKLGALPPPPPKRPSEDELEERRKRREERKRDVLFAASSIRPFIDQGAKK